MELKASTSRIQNPTIWIRNYKFRIAAAPTGWNIVNVNGTVISNTGGVLTGTGKTQVTISPTGSAIIGKVSVRMQNR